jgi:hypothetical protein
MQHEGVSVKEQMEQAKKKRKRKERGAVLV